MTSSTLSVALAGVLDRSLLLEFGGGGVLLGLCSEEAYLTTSFFSNSAMVVWVSVSVARPIPGLLLEFGHGGVFLGFCCDSSLRTH
jgi:hypothetical protein